MKKVLLLFILIITAQYLFSQVSKVNFPNAKAIEKMAITSKMKGSGINYQVSFEKLKPGVNYLVLQNKDKFFIEIVGKKVKAFTVSKPDGTMIGTIKIGDQTMQYACSGNICACIGDEDCNRMFSGSTCGPIAVCVDDVCACYKSL